MPFSPSRYQQGFFDFIADGSGSAVVEAVAGSGKTTTVIASLDYIPEHYSICMTAFNKSIAQELTERVPDYVQVMTLNGMGFRAYLKIHRSVKIDAKKTQKIVNNLIGSMDFEIIQAVTKLVALAKNHGISPLLARPGLMLNDYSSWAGLIDHYALDVTKEDRRFVIEQAKEALLLSVQSTGIIDFDDQLYMPVLLRAPFQQFDFLFVDEAQDVSPIQREMLKRSLALNGRLIAVGDPRQAIYGFRGADSNSMNNIAKEFSAQTFPLSISYRCPKSVVAYAQQIVNHIESADTAPDGTVMSLKYFSEDIFYSDDMIVCRNTAPLISLAFSLIGKHVACQVIGRDIGQGMIALIKKLKSKSIKMLIEKLEAWRIREIEKALARDDDDKIDSITDKAESIQVFIDHGDPKSIDDLIGQISYMLSDTKRQVLTLCTVHKAKGLEADTVYVLNPGLMPAPWASKRMWQQEQERNLQYVAFTRAKSKLIFINSDGFVAKNLEKVA